MKILTKQNIEDIIFIDIETAIADPDFSEDSPYYSAWEYDQLKRGEEDIIGSYFKKAPFYAEYAIIVCITIGIVKEEKILLKTFLGAEKEILEGLNDALTRTVSLKSWLCGHTITEFDAPFIAKRCLVNQIPLHNWFDVAHLKPWEVPYLDLSSLWKSTGFKHSSLLSITTTLGLPSSKDDISGKDVSRLFYEGEIKRICAYCEKDVIAVIHIYRTLCYLPLLEVDPSTLSTEVDVITYLLNGGEYTDKVKRLLKQVIRGFSTANKERAHAILNAIPSKAKGKTTLFTKKDVKELNII